MSNSRVIAFNVLTEKDLYISLESPSRHPRELVILHVNPTNDHKLASFSVLDPKVPQDNHLPTKRLEILVSGVASIFGERPTFASGALTFFSGVGRSALVSGSRFSLVVTPAFYRVFPIMV
ncbi:hypothetical protein YC2023_066992 [Brassica napus]